MPEKPMSEERVVYHDGGKYPVDPKDPIGSRAWDELMRVTGMGEYAQNVRGGPPNPPNKSIPALPDRDTDLIIGEALSDREEVRKALDAARTELAQARGERDSARKERAMEREEKEGACKLAGDYLFRAERAEALLVEVINHPSDAPYSKDLLARIDDALGRKGEQGGRE